MAIALQVAQAMVITVLASAKAKLDMASPELALCTAAGGGDITQVKRLIDFGVLPNAGDYDKRTALHGASFSHPQQQQGVWNHLTHYII